MQGRRDSVQGKGAVSGGSPSAIPATAIDNSVRGILIKVARQ